MLSTSLIKIKFASIIPKYIKKVTVTCNKQLRLGYCRVQSKLDPVKIWQRKFNLIYIIMKYKQIFLNYHSKLMWLIK